MAVPLPEAPNIYKINYIFRCQTYGWSETWYRQGTDNVNAMFNLAQGYLEPRRNLLGWFARIEAVKVTNLSVPFLTLLGPPPGGAIPAVTSEGQRADNVWSAYLLTAYDASGGRHRPFMLRGMEDKSFVIELGNKERYVDDVKKRVDALAARLKQMEFSWLAFTKPLKTEQKEIYDVTLAPDRSYMTLRVFGHGITGLDYVKISRVKGTAKRYLKGLKRVRFIDGDTLRIDTPIPATAPFVYEGGGVLTLRRLNLVQVDSFEFRRYSRRDTGRPLFLSRGRRRARR